MFTKFKSYQKDAISIASRSQTALNMFKGKTIGEIGQSLMLEGEEISFDEKPNPKDPKAMIRNMYLDLRGNKRVPTELQKEWQFGISSTFPYERRWEIDFLMDCEVYLVHTQAVDNQNNKLTKEVNGKEVPIVNDGLEGRELQERLILGKPSGLKKSDDVDRPFVEGNDEVSQARKANAAINA